LAQKYREQGVRAYAGKYSYGRPEVQFRPVETQKFDLEIGAFCSIVRACVINLGSFGRHTTDFVSSYPLAMLFPVRGVARDTSAAEHSGGSVSIGSDVWLGEDSAVFAGISIGHGAVVGARALVTKNVPPYAIVAGVPARILRYRFPDVAIQRLLALSWWNWPDEAIQAAILSFHMIDIERALSDLEAAQPC